MVRVKAKPHNALLASLANLDVNERLVLTGVYENEQTKVQPAVELQQQQSSQQSSQKASCASCVSCPPPQSLKRKSDQISQANHSNHVNHSNPVRQTPTKKRRGNRFQQQQDQQFARNTSEQPTAFASEFFEQLAGHRHPEPEITDAHERDERFRLATCFKNAVCTITTNARPGQGPWTDFKIDIKQFTNIFGGQLTYKLPANRLVIKIGNQRYTIITFDSGKIILTNFFYLINNAYVYMLFVNLIQLLYALGIGTIGARDSGDLDDHSTNKKPEIRVRFLIENCIFSFQIAPHFFNRQFTQLYSRLEPLVSSNRNRRYEGLDAFHEFLKNMLKSERYIFVSRANCKHDNFPSDLIKFTIRRTDYHRIAEFKSPASQKRNNNNFVSQNLAILVFRNGKMIVTGMQTSEDLETTFKILFAIVDFFF